MARSAARVLAPATVGNVSPGFNVSGLAVDGLGDTVTIEIIKGPTVISSVHEQD